MVMTKENEECVAWQVQAVAINTIEQFHAVPCVQVTCPETIMMLSSTTYL